MAQTTKRDALAVSICRALGVDHTQVQRMTLTFEPGDVVRAHVDIMVYDADRTDVLTHLFEMSEWREVPGDG